MIISEKQLFCLIDVLKDSLKDVQIDGQFAISRLQRNELYANILNQQPEKLIKIEELVNEKRK